MNTEEYGERSGALGRRAGLAVGATLFVFFLWGPDLGLDSMQRRVTAITALTATMWVTVAIPVGAASLLPAILFPLFGVMRASEAAPVYMSDLVMLFIGAFIIALGLERWGVHRRMALAIVDRVGSSRSRLVLGFMSAAAFLSLWINNTATTLLMLPIAMAVIGRIEGERDDRAGGPVTTPFALCLLLGVAYSSSVGGMGTPVGTAPNQVFLGQFADRFTQGPKLSFGDWFISWAPLVVLFVPCAWLLMTRVLFSLRDDDKSRLAGDVIRAERAAQGRMSSAQKRMAIIFGLTALCWITRADVVLGSVHIPGWSRLFLGDAALDPAWYREHKNDISDSTVATLMALVCFVLPSGDKSKPYLMNWTTASRLPWEVLLLLGGGFCIARGFNVSGLDQVLGRSLSPLFEGQSSWVMVAGIALFMSLLTEMTSNTATTAVLLPVIASAAVAAHIHPLLVMMPATIAASAAFMLPAATPPNAVVFASRLVPVPRMARTGLWLNLLTVLLITVVFQLWVRRVLDIGDALPLWATD